MPDFGTGFCICVAMLRETSRSTTANAPNRHSPTFDQEESDRRGKRVRWLRRAVRPAHRKGAWIATALDACVDHFGWRTAESVQSGSVSDTAARRGRNARRRLTVVRSGCQRLMGTNSSATTSIFFFGCPVVVPYPSILRSISFNTCLRTS